MIHDATLIQGRILPSVLSASGRTPAGEVADRVEWGTIPRGGADLLQAVHREVQGGPVEEVQAPPAQVPAAEDASPASRRSAAALAILALATAAAVVGPLLAPSVAQAAPLRQAQATRNLTPVQAGSVQDVVDRFSADRQIYVVGNPVVNGVPLAQGEIARIQDMLKGHPNAYVVLVGGSANLSQDDLTLSRGIGNHPAFQGVVNAKTGEREGVVFMIYTGVTDPDFVARTGKDRAIFMRSEELPDRLGVGEAQFADPQTGAPRELMQLYIGAFQQGKGVAGGLGAVLERVNSTIAAHANQVYGAAETAVKEAETAFQEVQPRVKEFQQKHGAGGQLGSPDLEGWKGQLARAREALSRHDFATATSIGQRLAGEIGAYRTAIGEYEQAAGTAGQVEDLLRQTQEKLSTLEDNAQARSAREHQRAARESLEAFRVAYEAKDPAYSGHLEKAQSEAQQAARQAQASEDATQLWRNVKIYGGSAVVVAILAVAFALNRRAAGKGKEAEQELEAAMAEIGQKSRELLDLMNRADYQKVSHYTGRTQKLAEELVSHTADAITLAGGAEKFMAEAGNLIHAKTLGGRLANAFTAKNYERAIALLTDPEQKLPFDLKDSTRTVLEKGSQADSWREQLLRAGNSRVYEKSLSEVLTRLADRRDQAAHLLRQIEEKDGRVADYAGRVRTEAGEIGKSAAELQQAGELFAATSVSKSLLPAVEAELVRMESDPVQAADHLAGGSRPMRGVDSFEPSRPRTNDPAGRMTGEAGQIVTLCQAARSSLLTALQTAEAALQPHGVKTDWARQRAAALSEKLEKAGSDAVQRTVSQDLAGVKKELAELEAQIEAVVEHDRERREVAGGLIRAAETEIESARREILAELEKRGVHPDAVLHEPEGDPSTRTEQAHLKLDQVKAHLDVGDIRIGGENLESIRQLTAEAGQIVKDTREALAVYPATLEERTGRRNTLSQSAPASMERLKQGYDPEVLRLVAPEVEAGENVADSLTRAQGFLEQAGNSIGKAQEEFAQARLLATRASFAQADAELKSAQVQFEALAKAEKLLAQKQAAAEAELTALTERVAKTRDKATAVYVRGQAKKLLEESTRKLEEARAEVQRKPQHP
ncbi:MAG: hypothetical protein AB1758_20940, partial [Candidatus Eremiobacterota bacterium]